MSNPNLDVAQIISSFEFTDPTAPERLVYAADLGFLALQQPESPGDNDLVTLVGASTYSMPTGYDNTYKPATTLQDTPRVYAKADLLGKGAGTRLYNTEDALAGFPGQHCAGSLFAVTLHRDRIMDMRRPSDGTPVGKVLRIASHAGRLVQATLLGTATMVNRVHKSYGDSQAVLFSQPPNAALRQRRTGRQIPGPHNFLVLRDPDLTITRITRRKQM